MRWTDRVGAWWLFNRQPPPTVHEETSAEPKVTLTIRLPPELHARLKTAAEDRLVAVNWLTNRAIEELLDNLLPPEETFTR